DCGDAGHILLSRHVAEDLEQYRQWRPLLHDLGSCEVKHGMQVAIVNLWSDDVGNRQLPQKFRTLRKQRARVRWAEVAAALLLLTGHRSCFRFRFKEISKIDIHPATASFRAWRSRRARSLLRKNVTLCRQLKITANTT